LKGAFSVRRMRRIAQFSLGEKPRATLGRLVQGETLPGDPRMNQDKLDQLRTAILEVVPKDGSKIINKKVRETLEHQLGSGFSEEAYNQVRSTLLAEGILGKGRGPGGSVYRVQSPDAQAAPSATSTGSKPTPRRANKIPPPDAESPGYGSYQYPDEATLRPDVGIQDQFPQSRPPTTYRYDSSLAPELVWDENAEREFAEWLLNLITTASEKSEHEVFSEPQQWHGTGERFHSIRECKARLNSLTKPFLNWAGKAERHQISVPTVPLFVHERHSTRAILETLKSYKASGRTLDLFGDPTVDLADRLDAYQHTGPWTNRMILGDSLQVMNSLLDYEGLGAQIQMIYFDPPYGVRFGSNFQPFVRNRDMGTKHGKDDWMIREPEMVKAYRDTWELGLHSYLSYLRDRLLLARDLLTPTGSLFLQISDENLAHAREVLDEVFGSDNFVVTIPIKKTGSQKGGLLQSVNDYLLWYTKSKDHADRYCTNLYEPAPVTAELVKDGFSNIEFQDGTTASLTDLERRNGTERGHYRNNPAAALADFPGSRLFKADPSTSGNPGKSQAQLYEYMGRVFDPGIDRGLGWKHSAISNNGESGMDRLAAANRLYVGKNQIAFKRYHDDFGYRALTNWWDGIGGPSNPVYAVQTNNRVLERCILMATKPGDLVFDPTCGSGTTAYVAEQWGRRWITCDTSRVPLALARQRLLTATFPWYELNDPRQGPARGFVYKRKQNRRGEEVGGLVPHVTAASVANDEEPELVTLVDRPEENRKTTRVCGTFTVEATIRAETALDETTEPTRGQTPRTYLDRMIEVLRRAHTLSLPGNQTLALGSVGPVTDCEWIHAEAQQESQSHDGQRIAIAFGPEDGAVHSQFVYEAAREAHYLKYDHLYIFGFAIQAKARELAEHRAKLRIPVTYVNITPDVAMTDLLKTSHTDQIFSVTGLPDLQLKRVSHRDDGEPLYQAKVRGLDIFRPDNLETESVAAENLPCWMLDTDYNGLVFCASQVFFPRTGAWDNMKKSLKTEFDDSVWEHLAGTESEPFPLGSERRIAVKVIDERGNELMVVRCDTEASDE